MACAPWFSRILWCIGTACRFSCSVGNASDYAPRAFYPVRDERVTVLYALAHLVGCVTTVNQRYQRQDGQQEEHEDADNNDAQCGAEKGVNHEDHDPGNLVPEGLQGVEA